ncbi:hypothetical protein Cylst_3926 [Cylindrospermum stagnale PCC 7417]|uniref:Uncharacterized protein n=1 Tax=Cylindrospermum stagnale PCC 7417 TaxID=56107 RepID=K9X0N4_9NOST|nr:hypothetical protein Cylst_3926 [Cylindrospermum stagnale PCC 7417]
MKLFSTSPRWEDQDKTNRQEQISCKNIVLLFITTDQQQ